MKRTWIALVALACVICTNAKPPKWLKKVRRAQVTVIAFDKEGTPKESQGVFIDEEGTVLTEYDILKGAVKATVIDFHGTEHQVHRVKGANSMYNVAKLSVIKNKTKAGFLPPDTMSVATGKLLYILPTAKAEKSVPCTPDTVVKEEIFKDSFHYYTLSKAHNERLANCPVLNETGNLTGLLQMAVKEGENSFVIDASYVSKIEISPLDATNSDLKAIQIPKALPSNAQDAATFIFLSGIKDTTIYRQYVDDYMAAYPDSLQGYILKAEMHTAFKEYDKAEQTYNQALGLNIPNKDEIHYSWAKALYELNLDPSYKVYGNWTMEQSLRQAQAATAVKDMPIYKKIQADCLYALKRYAEAKEIYIALAKTNLRNPDLFLYAAQCQQMEDANNLNAVIALQDSALNCYNKPYPAEAAPILLMRGNNYAKAGKPRQAITDLIIYEGLYSGILSAEFYYQREQLAMQCRMYPTALNDIDKAIRLNPSEPVFRAELAAICYRINMIDDAIAAAQAAINIDSKFADAYRILGVCLEKKGNKQEARKNLQKAIELGDSISKELLNNLK